MAINRKNGLKNLKYKVNPQEAVEKYKKEQEQAFKEREEAKQKATTVAKTLKQEGKEVVTRQDIIDYLFNGDFRDYEKYRTWIKLLCENGEIPEVENENCK